MGRAGERRRKLRGEVRERRVRVSARVVGVGEHAQRRVVGEADAFDEREGGSAVRVRLVRDAGEEHGKEHGRVAKRASLGRRRDRRRRRRRGIRRLRPSARIRRLGREPIRERRVERRANRGGSIRAQRAHARRERLGGDEGRREGEKRGRGGERRESNLRVSVLTVGEDGGEDGLDARGEDVAREAFGSRDGSYRRADGFLDVVELVARADGDDGDELVDEGGHPGAGLARGGVRELDEHQSDLLGGFLHGMDADDRGERGHQGLERGRGVGEARDVLGHQRRALLANLLHGVREPAEERREHRGGERLEELVPGGRRGRVAGQEPALVRVGG